MSFGSRGVANSNLAVPTHRIASTMRLVGCNQRSASAFWVDFNGDETVSVTVDDLPCAVLSTVHGRCSQCHCLRLAINLPREPLELDSEAERIAEAGNEVLCVPGCVVEGLGRGGQEVAYG